MLQHTKPTMIYVAISMTTTTLVLLLLFSSSTSTIMASSDFMRLLMQYCVLNSQIVFGFEKQFAVPYCEDLYFETGNVLTPEETLMHQTFWTEFYRAQNQQPQQQSIIPPTIPGGSDGVDIESMHDDFLCSLPGTGVQPSFRDAC